MKTELEKYAQRTGTIASLIGLVVAYLLMAGIVAIDEGILKGLLWIQHLDNVWPNLLLGCAGILISAYALCGFLVQGGYSHPVAYTGKGMGLALLVLFAGTIIGSTLGFVQECDFHSWPMELGDDVFDYYAKPLYWIGMLGSLPAAIIGGIWGYIIFRESKYHAKQLAKVTY